MNETRTTAYALNELAGREREIFESNLAADPRLQDELQSVSRAADALAQVMAEPAEGLDPRSREKLLRAIVENQKTFQQRRKIIRLAVPVSLAAAASIAVLLWVAGEKTAQSPGVAAASAPEEAEGRGNYAAEVSPGPAPVVFKDTENDFAQGGQSAFGVQTARTVILSDNARAWQGTSNPSQPEVRQRSLLTSEEIPLWGVGAQ